MRWGSFEKRFSDSEGENVVYVSSVETQTTFINLPGMTFRLLKRKQRLEIYLTVRTGALRDQ